ncbi:MAG: lysylphosphatidylglycerol synthase domain-containing protein [Candidatus Binatia bacterium]
MNALTEKSTLAVVKKWCLAVIVPVIFTLLFASLYHNWTEVRQYAWGEHLSGSVLALSLLFLLAYLGLLVIAWKKLLEFAGSFVSFREAFCAFFYSTLGKYLPGKVWTMVGRVYIAESNGVRRRDAVISVFFENVLIVMSGLIVCAVTLPFWWPAWQRYYPLLLVACVLGAVSLFASPRLLAAGLNMFPTQFSREGIHVGLQPVQLFTTLLIYLIGWGIFGLAFHLFINSIYAIPLHQYPAALGSFALAWIVGFLSVFTLGGIGVREGMLTLLLKQWLPLEIALVIALGSRIWTTVAELIGVGVAYVLTKGRIEGTKP